MKAELPCFHFVHSLNYSYFVPQTNPLQLSIIIVNYNVQYFLEQCLGSVIKACTNIRAEIFVVDNHSTDGSRAYFHNRFPQVRFIWKPTNDGFAKANNEALQQATGEQVLFLNPDTIVPEDCFELCLAQLQANPAIGALGVKMIDGSGRYLPESKRGFPGLFTSLYKMSGLTARFPQSKLFARYYLGHLPSDKSTGVDVLAGAFMLVRKNVLDQVGSFDPAFFMYAEDIDLSYRILQAGYTNYYFAGTTIIHFKGESTKKEDAAYIQRFYGAMGLFVRKHYSGLRRGLYVAFIRMAIALKLLWLRVKPGATQRPDNALAAAAKVVADKSTYSLWHWALDQRFAQVTHMPSLQQLPAAGSGLLLSETALSYKQIISLLEQHAGQYVFYIHGSGTASMVGSSDKNTLGSALVCRAAM